MADINVKLAPPGLTENPDDVFTGGQKQIPPVIAPVILPSAQQYIVCELVPSITRQGKTDKFPCNNAGMKASIHDTLIRMTYEQAEITAERLSSSGRRFHIGFVFTKEDQFFFIDLDNCKLPDGQWSPLAMDICTMFPGAYIEISQSGNGLHIVGQHSGSEPIHKCKNTDLNIECYTSGRFIAFGNVQTAIGNALTEHTTGLYQCINKYFNAANTHVTVNTLDAEWTTTHHPESNPILDDIELIKKALVSESAGSAFGNKANLKDLWTANPEALGLAYPDEYGDRMYDASSTDMALAIMMMWWTGGNCERVERLMRMSSLKRPKWDTHKTYLKHFTIGKAHALVTEHYGQSQNPVLSELVPAVKGGFEQFSLRGQSFEMKKQMLEDKFVLGRLALLGQMLIIFAPPNAGKTLIVIHLIIKAIHEGAINGDDLIYINADDGYRGLIQKIELAEKYGFHMVAPDHNGFKSIMLKQMLIQYSESGEAKNKIVILDTIKKFADHMNKKESADFATVIRSFVSKGGTVIALSHVNKRRGADDKLIHAGTSDFKDDFDTVYMLDVIEQDITFKTVSFTNEKSRGDNIKQVSYRYLNREGDDYLTILNSVNELNDDDLKRAKERSRLNEKYDDDKSLITSLVNNMNAHITGKKSLIDTTLEQTSESKRAIEKVLKRYEGDDINLGHQWKLSVDRLNNNLHTYTAHNHIKIT